MFKKNTAVTGLVVHLISATDGSDITTGTPVGYYTLDGGSQTAIADVAPVHEGNGEWSFDLLSGEMNGNIVGLTFTHASAITVHFTIKTDTKIVSDVSSELATAQTDLNTITGSDGAVIATDGLDAAALATTALDEIADAVWDEVISAGAHSTAETAGKRLIDSETAIDGVQTDLDNATDGLGALKILIDALNDVSSANVLTQVNAALDTAISELGVATPAVTPTIRTGLMLIYMAIRNKRDTTATSDEIHNDAGAPIADATLSDDTVTFTKTKYT